MKQEKLLLLFPLTGIYGLLFLAEGVDLLQFYRPAVYGFAAVFGLALWALAVFAGKFLAPVLAAAAAGWTVAFFLAGQELLEEFRLAGRILAGEYSGEAVTVTTAVLFLIPVVLSLIFFPGIHSARPLAAVSVYQCPVAGSASGGGGGIPAVGDPSGRISDPVLDPGETRGKKIASGGGRMEAD